MLENFLKITFLAFVFTTFLQAGSRVVVEWGGDEEGDFFVVSGKRKSQRVELEAIKKQERISVKKAQNLIEENKLEEIIDLFIEYRDCASLLLDYIFDEGVSANIRADVLVYILSDPAFKKYSLKIGFSGLVLLGDSELKEQTKAEIAESILNKAYLKEYHERVARRSVDLLKKASVNCETKALLTLGIFLNKNLESYQSAAARRALSCWEELLNEELEVVNTSAGLEGILVDEPRRSALSLAKEVMADNILRNPLLITYHEKALLHASDAEKIFYVAKKEKEREEQEHQRRIEKRKRQEKAGIKRKRKTPAKLID